MAKPVFDVVFRAEHVLHQRQFSPLEIGVRDGKIEAIEPLGANLSSHQVVDVQSQQVLLPGLVDTHVHVNEPGRTEWEGFDSATRAAAAGGVTTLIDMPLNSIPSTVNTDALAIKQAAAKDQIHVDTGFWGGAVPGNIDALRPLHDNGVFGFKCFLEHSGVDEFPKLETDEMQRDMAELKKFDGLMIVHAEDAHTLEHTRAQGIHASRRYADFLASRPGEAESVAIQSVIEAVRATGCRAHILHLSNAECLEQLAAAKAEGLPITVETCPHYLTFLSEDIQDGKTAFKCAPPIREKNNRSRLWQGLQDGVIDIVVSDHSPSTLELKENGHGDFDTAWGGISSLQLGLSVMWTEAQQYGIELSQVVTWMAEQPARIARVAGKGQLALGYDADLVIFDPQATWTVDAGSLHHRNPITPYDRRELQGQVQDTWLRGKKVDFHTPKGQFLRR
ncbi:MAG TPA: allantoinase AllB [Enteractinococcus helveticum]|uniref:allantoinase n=1 Tax=Enteractinococcus helveticum TaxID=1837282 RepID=A0A921FLH3_9MICC|nr:allantoinase AllB [Enteractinococcus helveticum]HJF13482.1 allantoinase AllB [Enteractinococcus helveticum]